MFPEEFDARQREPEPSALDNEAWDIYCTETAGSMDVKDFWHELPEHVQNIYRLKARGERVARQSKKDFEHRMMELGAMLQFPPSPPKLTPEQSASFIRQGDASAYMDLTDELTKRVCAAMLVHTDYLDGDTRILGVGRRYEPTDDTGDVL